MNQVGSKLGQRLKHWLVGNVFAKCFLWFKGVFDKNFMSLFYSIGFRENGFLPNMDLKNDFHL